MERLDNGNWRLTEFGRTAQIVVVDDLETER